MRRSIQLGLAFTSGMALFACGGEVNNNSSGGPTGGGGGGAGGGGAASSLPCDVEAVLSANCWQCHSNPSVYGAPMPLKTHADLQAPAISDASKKVYERVGERIHDAASP